MKTIILSLSICPLFALFMSAQVLAQGEALDPHIHGQASLNVSVAETSIELDLDSSLASFISFEHVPSTPEQIKEFEAMDTLLKQPEKLLGIPKDYGCELKESSVEYQDMEGEEGHSHDHEGDDDHHDHDGDHHDHDGEHHHEEGAVHRDVEAAYSFSCKKVPSKDGQIDLGSLFKSFPLLEDLDAQIVTPDGQKAQELNPETVILKW